MDKVPKKNEHTTNDVVSSPWQRRPKNLYERLLERRQRKQLRPVTLYERLLENRGMRAPFPLRQRGDMEGQFQNNDLAVNAEQNSFTEKSSPLKDDNSTSQNQENLPTPEQLALIRKLLKARDEKKETVSEEEKDSVSQSKTAEIDVSSGKDVMNDETNAQDMGEKTSFFHPIKFIEHLSRIYTKTLKFQIFNQETNSPIKNEDYLLIGSNEEIRHGASDSEGYCEEDNIKPGRYKLICLTEKGDLISHYIDVYKGGVISDPVFQKWILENKEEFKGYYEDRQENEQSCISKLLFPKSDDPLKEFINCKDEPEFLKNLGLFNPELYFLIVQDDKDVRLFREIEEIATGTKLILFTAAAFQVYEIVEATRSLSKSAASLTEKAIEVKSKVIIKSEKATKSEKGLALAEAGLGLNKLYKATTKRLNKNLNSSLQMLAETSLKLPMGVKNIVLGKIQLRIQDLRIKHPNWYINERNKAVRKFLEDYVKMIKGGKVRVF